MRCLLVWRKYPVRRSYPLSLPVLGQNPLLLCGMQMLSRGEVLLAGTWAAWNFPDSRSILTRSQFGHRRIDDVQRDVRERKVAYRQEGFRVKFGGTTRVRVCSER